MTLSYPTSSRTFIGPRPYPPNGLSSVFGQLRVMGDWEALTFYATGVPFVQCVSLSFPIPYNNAYPLIWAEYLDYYATLQCS